MKVHIVLIVLLFNIAFACVNRNDAITRAMEWVKDKIPYDANKYHQGYVQGCMGLVGYAWQFPKPGVYSGDLIHGGYCKAISKDKMTLGDIMVCPGTHQLLFHSWTDSKQNYYWGIELGGPSGTIKHQIPWPYFSSLNPSCYIPCKV